MSLAVTNTDRLAALKQEAEQNGIRVLPPDINRSGADFSVERLPDGHLAIRYALAAIKKVGFAAMQALVAARGERVFADIADFAARVDPRYLNRMQAENLIRAGTFNSLDNNRARLIGAVETIFRMRSSVLRKRQTVRLACSARPGGRSRCAYRMSPIGRNSTG